MQGAPKGHTSQDISKSAKLHKVICSYFLGTNNFHGRSKLWIQTAWVLRLSLPNSDRSLTSLCLRLENLPQSCYEIKLVNIYKALRTVFNIVSFTVSENIFQKCLLKTEKRTKGGKSLPQEPCWAHTRQALHCVLSHRVKETKF